jgi:hypothetical protein
VSARIEYWLNSRGTHHAMNTPWFADWYALVGALTHWLAGGDPYGPYPTPNGTLFEAGYYAYPPPSLLLAAPLTLLPWWLSGLLVQAVAIVALERWVRRDTGRSVLPWLLLWPPLIQGLLIGQTTLIALAALLHAELAFRERRDRAAGLLLALALLKPQVGLLAVACLLLMALRARRWRFLAGCAGASAVLWGGAAVVLGPAIYAQWLAGLQAYSAALPDRPMLFPPLGPLLLLAALLLWRRGRRADPFALALLAGTLAYPLSVLYILSPMAFALMRLRPTWQPWALALAWAAPLLLARLPPGPDALIASVQAMAALTMLAALLPPLSRLSRHPAAAKPGSG